MVKEISLTYNNFSGEYYLDFDRNAKDRIYFNEADENKLVGKLRENIDFKRKSVLYLERGLSVSLFERISKLCENTNVQITFKKG